MVTQFSCLLQVAWSQVVLLVRGTVTIGQVRSILRLTTQLSLVKYSLFLLMYKVAMNFVPPDSLFVQCVNKEQEVGNKEYKIGEAFMSLADLF